MGVEKVLLYNKCTGAAKLLLAYTTNEIVALALTNGTIVLGRAVFQNPMTSL